LQVVRLQLVGDSLIAKNAVLIDSLSARVAGSATTPAAPAADPRALFQSLQPLLQQGRGNYLAAIESIKEILTPEQWEQLPENFRNPRLQARPGAGQNRPRPPRD